MKYKISKGCCDLGTPTPTRRQGGGNDEPNIIKESYDTITSEWDQPLRVAEGYSVWGIVEI